MKKILNKFNNTVWNGLAIGLLLPAVLCAISWYLIHHIKALANADLFYIVSIGINALLMQYFFNLDKEKSGKGVLAATFLCAFVFYFYKVF